VPRVDKSLPRDRKRTEQQDLSEEGRKELMAIPKGNSQKKKFDELQEHGKLRKNLRRVSRQKKKRSGLN